MRRPSMHRLLLGALLFGALLPLRASAQQCTQSAGLGVTVSPALINFSTPTFVDFDNGSILYQTTVTLTVSGQTQGNKPWTLCVASQQPDLGSADGVTKPIGDLQVQVAGGAWVPLSVVPQSILKDRGNGPQQINLRILLSWAADPVGSFGTVILFTVN